MVICFSAGYIAHQETIDKRPMPLEHEDHVTAFFSPKGGCTDVIVEEINKASVSIHIYAFSFTSRPIANALIRAMKRGVEVRVIADREQDKSVWSQLGRLQEHGAKVWIDRVSGFSHSKVMVFDGLIVLTGSFNFSKNAETKNRENIVLIKKRSLAERYLANWHKAEQSALLYVG